MKKQVLAFGINDVDAVKCMLYAQSKVRGKQTIVTTSSKELVEEMASKGLIAKAYVFANPTFSKEMFECFEILTQLASNGIKSDMIKDKRF